MHLRTNKTSNVTRIKQKIMLYIYTIISQVLKKRLKLKP